MHGHTCCYSLPYNKDFNMSGRAIVAIKKYISLGNITDRFTFSNVLTQYVSLKGCTAGTPIVAVI